MHGRLGDNQEIDGRLGDNYGWMSVLRWALPDCASKTGVLCQLVFPKNYAQIVLIFQNSAFLRLKNAWLYLEETQTNYKA